MERGLVLNAEQNPAVKNFLLSAGSKFVCKIPKTASYWDAGIGINDYRSTTHYWGDTIIEGRS